MHFVREKSGRAGVALVAAYMLVLQSLVGAFALGAAAASPVLLDVFGNPLCISSASGVASEEDHGDHGSMPDCCIIACSMFAPTTADERAPRSLYNPLVKTAQQTEPVYESVIISFALEHSPGSPRSPPFAFG